MTAGGTREAIDPVRFLGNRSSGRMGNALATAAADRGAAVTLITTVAAPEDSRLAVIHVESALEMDNAVRVALAGEAAVLVMAAAVADYRVAEVSPRKLKKTASLTLDLVQTVDILRGLADDPLRAGVLVMGFAAETDDLEANAAGKVRDKGLDLIVVNDVSRSDIAMGSNDNEVMVLDAQGVVARISKRAKAMVAEALLDIVEERMGDGVVPPRPNRRP